uniref:Uncharacterized protein n=1 Tax=Capra hircus TaxID=9925 RepID=A0A8C2SF71_CAPHI
MPGKLLWGDIMELEAPLEETESQRKERQKVLSQPGVEPGFLLLRALSLSNWTTREIPF